MPESEKVRAQLEALRQHFVQQLPNRLQGLENQFECWMANQDAALLQEFHRAAHSLTGAGATFGCQGVSDTARVLEQCLKQRMELGQPADADAAAVAQVRSALARVEEEVRALHPDAAAGQAQTAPAGGPLVYVLMGDAAERNNLMVQLDHFGYRLRGFEGAAALAAAVEAEMPKAIIADVALDAGAVAGTEVIGRLQAGRQVPIPVIFIASSDDFHLRLAAVRAGGLAYLGRPVSHKALVETLEALIAPEEIEPYRVLVVDDDAAMADYHALLLQEAGMVTRIITDPMQVLTAMQAWSPELVLMDMYMPLCSGTELAAVIRQQEAYVSVPIVYLSAEQDRGVQLEALRQGGDDFLGKPIRGPELVSAVAIRANRYRTIRSLMVQDSLTGLLNHSAIVGRLAAEVARATRADTPVTFVMIDIDHFKQVNDTYGHGAGDAVIKSLALLLQQRLRRSDSVGRYGGEEFAVIMPDTPLESAVRIMDDLREHFSHIEHRVEQRVFNVTFSCGLVTAPPLTDCTAIMNLADQRLYAAKRGGRNRVVAG